MHGFLSTPGATRPGQAVSTVAVVNLRDAWEANATAWARAVRDPDWDHHYTRLNMPSFLELVPDPGMRTLDLGCGEGRVGRLLQEHGHRVVGVDVAPTMVALAAQVIEAVEADAAALPFEDRSFDLVVAFMSLHDMDDADTAVSEVARVLTDGGRFCFAIEHPFQKAGTWPDPEDLESPFVVSGSYFDVHRMEVVVERDGLAVRFPSIHRPLEAYTMALERAGLRIEALREPIPDDDFVAWRPRVARWRRMPIFLHVRAVKGGT